MIASGPRTPAAIAAPTAEAVASPLESLRALTRGALSASGELRAQRAAELNAALRLLPKTAPPEDVARFLLEALEQKTWEGLEGSDGWTCRAVATQSLIDLGYPWALWVHPDDLGHLRQTPLQPAPLDALLKPSLSIAGLLAAGVVGELFLNMHLPLELPLLAGAVTLAAASTSLFSKRPSRRRTGLVLTTVWGGLLLALHLGTGAGLALGLASLASALVTGMASPTRSTVRRLD